MAQHGYLREFDEGWDRDEERGRWRDSDEDWHDRERSRFDRNFMLGERGSERQRDVDRGFFDRMGDRAREMFRDDDAQYRPNHESRWRDRGDSTRWRPQQDFGGRSDQERSPRSFSSHQDDHYRSWRDRQMRALDRDYEDYCRERELQFHRDFDNWRSNRQSGGSSDVMELNNPTRLSGKVQSPPPPLSDATLGTNDPENSFTGDER